MANKGSAPAAHAAVLALGSIGTKHSNKALISLNEALPKGKLPDLTKKQLNHQYRFTRMSKKDN